MAFTLQAIVGTATYNLSDGNPFSVEEATGMGLASIIRYEQGRPLQHGVTALDYNLLPRTITIPLNFYADTDAELDGYRDDLNTIFRPYPAQTVQLRVTRDDGAVRQIDTFATDNAIELDRRNRPGHLHRAVVQLRAADPLWYDPMPGTATLEASVGDWWLGAGMIGTANVLESVGTPTADQAWTWAGSVGVSFSGAPGTRQTASYAVLWRMAGIPGQTGTADQYAWSAGTADPQYFIATDSTEDAKYRTKETSLTGGVDYSGTTRVYLLHHQFPTFQLSASGSVWFLVDNGEEGLYTYINGQWAAHSRYSSFGTPVFYGGGYWAGNGTGTAAQWGTTVTHCAIYQNVSVADCLNVAQIIDWQINDGTVNPTAAVDYAGNMPDYPIITLVGPVTDPVLTNVSTGKTLDFTGSTIPAGVTYTIDLRSAALSVTDSGGTVRTNQLTEDSDLSTWAIEPDPLVIDGINNIALEGTATSGSTTVSIVYTNRYLSY